MYGWVSAILFVAWINNSYAHLYKDRRLFILYSINDRIKMWIGQIWPTDFLDNDRYILFWGDKLSTKSSGNVTYNNWVLVPVTLQKQGVKCLLLRCGWDCRAEPPPSASPHIAKELFAVNREVYIEVLPRLLSTVAFEMQL